MTFYNDQPALFTRIGRTSERPTVPPDKQALFWDIQTGFMYAVNDAMEWVRINEPFPAKSGVESYNGNFTFATTPSGLLMASTTNMLVLEVVVQVETVFDPGITAKIGDNANTDRLFPSDLMNLQELGEYRSHPMYTYPIPTNIEVRVDAGSAQGFCRVFMLYDLDSEH